MDFLNNSEYFNQQSKLELASKQETIKGVDSTIKQIDLTLEKNIRQESGSKTKMIYFDGEEKVNNIFEQKSELLTEKAEHLSELSALDKTIKDISIVINLKTEVKAYQKRVVTTPLFFLFLFALFIKFKRFLANQKIKRQ